MQNNNNTFNKNSEKPTKYTGENSQSFYVSPTTLKIAEEILFLYGAGVMKVAESATWMNDNGFAGMFAGFSYNLWRGSFERSHRFKNGKIAAAMFTFAGCSIAEGIQAMQLPIVQEHPRFIGSVYDPKDFLAYAIGIGTAYTLDVLLESAFKKSEKYTKE